MRAEQSEEQAVEAAEQTLIERWQARQGKLAEMLEQWGATEGERRIDWMGGQVEWLSATGEPVMSATMKALCSYALDEESLLMAWANEGSEQGAVIGPIAGVPERIEPCGEGEAWLWAMRLADRSGADYLLRIASPNFLVFLGLWAVEPFLSDEEGVLEGGTPHAFVVKVLDELRHALLNKGNEPLALRRLFLSQGDSLHQSAQLLTDDGADPRLLRETVEAITTTGTSLGQRRFGLLPPSTLAPREVEALHKQLLRLRATWLRSAAEQAGR